MNWIDEMKQDGPAEFPAHWTCSPPLAPLHEWICQHCGKTIDESELGRYDGIYSSLHFAHTPNGKFCGWLNLPRNLMDKDGKVN
jgi:hypothetical protein